MKFILNGKEKIFNGDPKLSLLKYLRDQALITSPKDGCSPQAACGACTVELNGKAVLSCVTPMSKVADGKVLTTEGLEDLIKKIELELNIAKEEVEQLIEKYKQLGE